MESKVCYLFSNLFCFRSLDETGAGYGNSQGLHYFAFSTEKKVHIILKSRIYTKNKVQLFRSK